MSFNITPVASGYQEIHPYSAMNIDSVKINTSLIMMKEWLIECDVLWRLFCHQSDVLWCHVTCEVLISEFLVTLSNY